MKRFSLFLLLSGLFLQITIKDLHAQGVCIVDCNGKTRALRSQPSVSGDNVEVDVIDSNGDLADKGELKLTNEQGQTLTSSVKDGVATFLSVPTGTWVLTSENTDLFFTRIAFSDYLPPAFWESASNALIATGAVVGGVLLYIIIDNATDGSSGGDDNHGGDSNTCATCTPSGEAPSIAPF